MSNAHLNGEKTYFPICTPSAVIRSLISRLSDHLFCSSHVTERQYILATHTHTCIYTHAHTHAQTHAHTHTCTHKHKHRGREVLELIQRDKTYMRSIKNSLSHTHMQTHTHIHTHAHTCTHRGRESIVFCVIRLISRLSDHLFFSSPVTERQYI